MPENRFDLKKKKHSWKRVASTRLIKITSVRNFGHVEAVLQETFMKLSSSWQQEAGSNPDSTADLQASTVSGWKLDLRSACVIASLKNV